MKLRVEWTEVVSYEQIVEIDDADWAEAAENEDLENGLIDDAIALLEEESPMCNYQREIDYFEVV